MLKPGGMLFVFEHNPLNPLTRHAVNTCVFDENAHLILARTMNNRVRKAGFARRARSTGYSFPARCAACGRSKGN